MKRTRTTRRPNFGAGDLFDFHGAFTEKKDAEAKERKVKGAFIKTVWYRGGPRYGVLTRNPKAGKGNPFGVLTALDAFSNVQTVKSLLGGKKKRRTKNKRRNTEWGTYDKGIFHPWTRRPKSRKKPARRKLNNADTDHFQLALKTLYPGKAVAQLSMAQLSHVLRAAQDLKAGKAISRKANPTKRNYADATELYTQFHGRGPKATIDTGHKLSYLESDMLPVAEYGTHPTLAQLGKLVSIDFGPNDDRCNGKRLSWEGSRDAPDLASEHDGLQLFLIGGNQFVDVKTIPWEPSKFRGGMLMLGYAFKVEYFTQKVFDAYNPTTYFHKLGEEDGKLPKLVYDPKDKRVHFVYGGYVVKPEGIVN